MTQALTTFLLLPILLAITPASLSWEEVGDGLGYSHVRYRTPSGRQVTIHAFRFSPERFELRVLAAKEGAEGGTARELGRAAGALLAINGGFFLDDMTPLGLLVSQGEELSPLRRVDWGVFSVSKKRARLVHRRDWKRPEGLEFAIEAGPRLVVDGRVLSLKPQRDRRTVLGLMRDGRVVIVVTEEAVLLSEMGALMARDEAKGGFGCAWALNLDGGSSTQLWFERDGRTLDVPPNVLLAHPRVADVIALFPRRLPVDRRGH